MTMDRSARVELNLPALIDELAQAHTPDYLEAAIEHASSRPQRPAWTLPERWLPMDIATTRVPETRLPWRQIAVLALVTILLAALVGIYVGQQRRLPPPFGLAANGELVFAEGGDIVLIDPTTGVRRTIVAGPETDTGPQFSRDGTKIVFARSADSAAEPDLLFVTNADGTAPVQITPTPVSGLAGWTFSPDGRHVAARFVDPLAGILVAPTDASQPPTLHDLRMASTDDTIPDYRPDGSEIMFVGAQVAGTSRSIFGMDPVTGALRTITTPAAGEDIHSAAWSTDGSHIGYEMFPITGSGFRSRSHVVAADGTGDRELDDVAGTAYVGRISGWSNDGTRVVIARGFDSEGTREESVIVPVDGGRAVTLECGTDEGVTCPLNWTWSPDDTILLGGIPSDDTGATQYFVADPTTGEVRPTTWSAAEDMSWQRLAR